MQGNAVHKGLHDVTVFHHGSHQVVGVVRGERVLLFLGRFVEAVCFVVGHHVNGFAGLRGHTKYRVDETRHIASNGDGGGVVGNVLRVSGEAWV